MYTQKCLLETYHNVKNVISGNILKGWLIGDFFSFYIFFCIFQIFYNKL